MPVRIITLRVDERWYQALTKQLRGAATVEEVLEEKLDAMIDSLVPDAECREISHVIWRETHSPDLPPEFRQ